MGRGAEGDRSKIRDLFADEWCSQAILNFVSITDAGRLKKTSKGVGVGTSRTAWSFFFFVYSYSHTTYIDHGGIHLPSFPARSPRSGGSLQAPLLPSAQACPEKEKTRPRKLTKERTKEMCGPSP